jgi:hypothetical protein
VLDIRKMRFSQPYLLRPVRDGHPGTVRGSPRHPFPPRRKAALFTEDGLFS